MAWQQVGGRAPAQGNSFAGLKLAEVCRGWPRMAPVRAEGGWPRESWPGGRTLALGGARHWEVMVCGVGSGGTLAGLTHFFRGVAPNVQMVLADPAGSILADYVRTGRGGTAGSWRPSYSVAPSAAKSGR